MNEIENWEKKREGKPIKPNKTNKLEDLRYLI